MRLDDKQLHDLLSQESPKTVVNDTLMHELMACERLFVVGKHHTFVCVLRKDHPRWEMVLL